MRCANGTGVYYIDIKASDTVSPISSDDVMNLVKSGVYPIMCVVDDNNKKNITFYHFESSLFEGVAKTVKFTSKGDTKGIYLEGKYIDKR